MKPVRRDPCLTHNLWCAHSPWPSADGRLVYVICGCGQRRVVAAGAWDTEAARRRKVEAQQRAAHALRQDLAQQPPWRALGNGRSAKSE